VVLSSPPKYQKHQSTDLTDHGFTEKAAQSQNRKAQTPEADEGEPPQEAFALQELGARLWRP
jgi:hypothetical protein